MSARIIAYVTGLLSVLREIQYTLARASKEPLAAIYVPTFQAIREEWQTVLLEEIARLDALSNAQALVSKADQGIDAFAGRVSRAVDDHTDGPTRKQIRTALFKNKSLSKFRRPVLGGQLDAMTDWADTLGKCGVPALAALAPEAATLVAAGEAARDEREKAQAANRHFRTVGQRKQFIDKLNATRKEAHGGLAKLTFEHPNLPQDFADGFFYSEPVRDDEETIDEVKASIEDLEVKLEERRVLLKKLEEEAENEIKAEQERQARAQAIDDLEAQAKALLEKAAALKAKSKK
ncbi:MAG: hypothetical protein IPM54_43140 [Polyangiaceae bacterium]|nr:hypothetical protein [Polyangiaceae bacterium]